MSGELSLLNHQRVRPLNRRLFRDLILELLTELSHAKDFDLTVHVVNAREMTRLNETHLQHGGSTDVITFDYAEAVSADALMGEIFVCMDEALIQAARFKTTWQTELVRYVVHGTLHLRGYDDTRPIARRKMKREENRLVNELNRRFRLRKLDSKTKVAT
ncbi:MAG: putative metal-dependent hydrolase [Pedosphaera sp.]|nr:putative metal-dependent hydrolase [Pedosphaera sp.]